MALKPLTLTKFVVNALNELSTVEKLVCFEVIMSKEPSERLVLRMPNLKVLSIEELWAQTIGRQNQNQNEPFDLIVDSKIERLFYPFRARRIVLNHPECITFLQTHTLTTYFSSLKNLQILRCFIISELFIGSLRRYFQHLNKIFVLYSSWKDYDTFRLIRRLMLVKKLFEWSNVKIYFLSILLSKPLEEYQLKKDEKDRWKGKKLKTENIQFAYYHCLEDRIIDKTSICYTNLVDALNDQMARLQSKRVALNEHEFPADFFQKFPNIRAIDVSERNSVVANNEARFAWFLSECKSLRKFVLKTNTTQFIIDQVSKRSSLQKVVFMSGPLTDANLDYTPLLRLKNLWAFKVRTNINQTLVALLIAMLKKLRYLLVIEVIASKIGLKIEKSSGLYCLTHAYNHAYNHYNYNACPLVNKPDLSHEALLELLNQI